MTKILYILHIYQSSNDTFFIILLSKSYYIIKNNQTSTTLEEFAIYQNNTIDYESTYMNNSF